MIAMKEYIVHLKELNRLSLGFTSFVVIMCKDIHLIPQDTMRQSSSQDCVVFCLINCRAVIGELDEELDSRLDLHNIRAEPLNPIINY